MAPRRTSRSAVKSLENSNFDNLKLNDVLCPICRSILIEPVTLPCSHGFCLSCFNGTMENTNLVCPLCRVRISSWLRSANKEKRVVNISLWKAIKETFPQHVNNKLNDVDENLEEIVNTVRIASPGSVRREYEEQKKIDELELKKQHEAEQKASEALIEKLKEEERNLRRLNEEKLKLDEQLAKKIANDLKPMVVPSSSKTNAAKKQNQIDAFVRRSSQKLVQGPLKIDNNFTVKEFTTKVLCQDRKPPSHQAVNKITKIHKKLQQTDTRNNSNDSIESECCYFKSIDHRNIPPSKAVRMTKITAKLACASTVIIGAPKGEVFFKHYSKSPFVCLKIVPESDSDIPKTHEIIDDTCIANSTPVRDVHNKQTSGSTPRKRKHFDRVGIPERISPRKKCRVNYSESSPVEFEGNHTDVYAKYLDNSFSPPVFCGFDNSTVDLKPVNSVKTNGLINGTRLLAAENATVVGEVATVSNKTEQENEDLEFARKLHEQLNNNGYRYYTRKSGTDTMLQARKRCSKQLTLDFMIAPQKLK